MLEKDRENQEEETEYENDAKSFLDRPIPREELLLAIIKVKTRQAAGPDGMLGEFFKFAVDEVVNFLTNLFNSLFDKGVYPKNWTCLLYTSDAADDADGVDLGGRRIIKKIF